MKDCFKIPNTHQTVKCSAIIAESHPGRSQWVLHMVAAPLMSMSLWMSGWKAPCRVWSHNAELPADLAQPSAQQQQGLIFRFISAVDVLLGKTTGSALIKEKQLLHFCPPSPHLQPTLGPSGRTFPISFNPTGFLCPWVHSGLGRVKI